MQETTSQAQCAHTMDLCMLCAAHVQLYCLYCIALQLMVSRLNQLQNILTWTVYTASVLYRCSFCDTKLELIYSNDIIVYDQNP